MPKKAATTEQKDHKRWLKLRAAIRNVWQYDHARKAVIDAASRPSEIPGRQKQKVFRCPLCLDIWPIELATVDHEPELGGFSSWEEFFNWVRRCFTGPQRVICKPCHKRKKRPTKEPKCRSPRS